MLIHPSVTESEGLLAGGDRPYKHEVMGNGIYSCLSFSKAKPNPHLESAQQHLSSNCTAVGVVDILMTYRTMDVKHHQAARGVGLRWPGEV